MPAAKTTGSHCGGHASGWLISASSLATLVFVVYGLKVAQKAAATPMSTSARKLEAPFFAYRIEMGECIKHVARQGRTWSSGVIGIPPESVAHPTEPQSPPRKRLSREEAAAGAA